MAAPIVKLPYQFNGLSLSKVAADLASHATNGWPPEVVIDFKLANLLKLLVVLVCLGAIVQRLMVLTY